MKMEMLTQFKVRSWSKNGHGSFMKTERRDTLIIHYFYILKHFFERKHNENLAENPYSGIFCVVISPLFCSSGMHYTKVL